MGTGHQRVLRYFHFKHERETSSWDSCRRGTPKHTHTHTHTHTYTHTHIDTQNKLHTLHHTLQTLHTKHTHIPHTHTHTHTQPRSILHTHTHHHHTLHTIPRVSIPQVRTGMYVCMYVCISGVTSISQNHHSTSTVSTNNGNRTGHPPYKRVIVLSGNEGNSAHVLTSTRFHSDKIGQNTVPDTENR